MQHENVRCHARSQELLILREFVEHLQQTRAGASSSEIDSHTASWVVQDVQKIPEELRSCCVCLEDVSRPTVCCRCWLAGLLGCWASGLCLPFCTALSAGRVRRLAMQKGMVAVLLACAASSSG